MKNRLLSSSAPSSFSILLDETCLRHARLETWKNGQSICEHALQPPGIWYVLEGQVKLVRLLTGGERKVLHLVSENHFFFEALFFQHEARVMTAVAVAPCRTAFFSRENVRLLVDENFSFRWALLSSLASKALFCGGECVDSLYSPTDERIHAVLRDLSFFFFISKPVLKLNQTMLAEHVGLHPVTVNRALKRLEKRGLIRIGRGRLELISGAFCD